MVVVQKLLTDSGLKLRGLRQVLSTELSVTKRSHWVVEDRNELAERLAAYVRKEGKMRRSSLQMQLTMARSLHGWDEKQDAQVKVVLIQGGRRLVQQIVRAKESEKMEKHKNLIEEDSTVKSTVQTFEGVKESVKQIDEQDCWHKVVEVAAAANERKEETIGME